MPMPPNRPMAPRPVSSDRDFGGGFGGFAGGGAIDEMTGAVPMSPMGGSFGAQLDAAVRAVNEALTYGRKRHGIMGGREQEEAGLNRMPMTPGNPSDSGLPKERPMPGPLPPTQNPFGKRVSEAQPEEEFEGEEAIPTEEDEETA